MTDSNEILIKNGNVVFENDVLKTDVLIKNGVISKFGNIESETANIIDAEGDYVFPGFIDMHTHLDDFIGKYYLADTYSTASEIALENGITTLFNFITQKKGNTLIHELELALEKLESRRIALAEQNQDLCNIAFHLTPVTFTDEDWNDIEYLISIGFKTFKFYTTYKFAGIYSSYERIEEILTRLKEYDVTTLIHCEDNDLIESIDTEKHDLTKAFTHTLLRPSEAEITAVKKILSLAEKTGAKIHIVHVSTKEAAELIYEYRKSYDNVTCETCPQYLFLDSEKLKTPGGHRFICSPPLRSPDNRIAMSELARKSYFNVFATDHCAFQQKDKDSFSADIRDVPNGLAGLGALPGLIFNLYGDLNNEIIVDISKRISTNPALITGLYPMKGTIMEDSDADIVILNFNGEKDIVSSHSFCYETYMGMKTKMNIKYTLLKGKIVFEGKNRT
ncbi:MAG: amidohydrolase family protein [Ignavibacteria bacterium]|nr:amidohydrolase family protein [Ignavibacteria bacterium]